MPCRSQTRSDIRWDIGTFRKDVLETSWDASTFPSDEIVAPLEDTNDLVIDDVVKIFEIYKAKPMWGAFMMKQLVPELGSKSAEDIQKIYSRPGEKKTTIEALRRKFSQNKRPRTQDRLETLLATPFLEHIASPTSAPKMRKRSTRPNKASRSLMIRFPSGEDMLLKPKARYAHTPISNDRAATAIRGCTAACVFTHSPNQIVHAVRSRQMSEAMATLPQKMLEVEAELREAKRAGRQDASKLTEHRDTIDSLQEYAKLEKECDRVLPLQGARVSHSSSRSTWYLSC
jgi:hypothetical protein